MKKTYNSIHLNKRKRKIITKYATDMFFLKTRLNFIWNTKRYDFGFNK